MFYFYEYLMILISIITIVCVKKYNEERKWPILNIYQQKNNFYWIKVYIMYIILQLKKLKTPKINIADFEKPQVLSSHEKPIDAVYFNGANQNGDHLVTGTARRKNGLIDGFLFLKINGTKFGILETPKSPGTSLYQAGEAAEYCAEGISLIPVEPMKKWKIIYNGPMKNHELIVDVQINLEFTSQLPWFNFDIDIDSWCMAKCIAKEPWSKDYFDTIKTIHQTHYEQPGVMQGTAIINGESYELNFDTFRDHSFGHQREWRLFHRYALHFINLENGDRINIDAICMPICMSSLYVGCVYSAKNNKTTPIQECDLQLYQHGENGTPPLDYAFSIKAGNNTYVIQVEVIDSPEFFISTEWESKVIERLCKFKVNGINGWGAAEWQYRNIKGKS